MRLTPAAALCTLAASLAGCQDVENALTASDALIEVQNLRQSVLLTVYTPPCTGGDSGIDRLPDVDVPPGGLSAFYILPGCYDVVGNFADGASRTVQDVRTTADVQSRVVFPD